MEKEVQPEMKKETSTAIKPVYPKTILAKGTVFEGNLISKGDVEIGGQLKGNVVTEGNIVLHSEVLGDVKAANLDILSNTLTGNVDVAGKVTLAAGSEIKGNITTQSLVCSGKIIGDMTVEESVCLDELSHVVGNVTSKNITISRGAYIDGKISIKR